MTALELLCEGDLGDPFEINAQIQPRWQDPRIDLQDDHHLWTRLLSLLFIGDRSLWGLFYGLRCGGGTIYLKEQELFVRMPDWDIGFRTKIRKKYLNPKSDQIQRWLRRASYENGSI